MTALKKFKLAIFLIIFLIISGTIGYIIIENGNIIESLYMTVITVSTVGFKEVFELSHKGKIFTIFLIFSSLSILAFGINIISSFIIEGEFRDLNRRRRMLKKINNLKNHYIICGSGQTAQQIIKQFQSAKINFIVINHRNEPEEEREKIRAMEDIIYIEGDATNDEILQQAKIEKAKGLAAALSTDTDNLFVILSARSLNPDMEIVARAIEESTYQKMRKAGANHVISPDIIGGARMASMIIRPSIIDFLDIISKTDGDLTLNLKMEQITVPESSSMNGKTLKQVEIPKKTGLIVVAIKKHSLDNFKYNPGHNFTIDKNDILVVLGNDAQIESLKEYIKI